MERAVPALDTTEQPASDCKDTSGEMEVR